MRGGTRSVQGENIMMLFIEHEDGMSISRSMASQVQVYARSIWRGFYGRGRAPIKWGNASREVHEEFFHKMEVKWEVLQYCENNWKTNKIATIFYSPWYINYSKSQGKNTTDEGRPDK
jgi:hypothetical protein